jgi:hypothetical protein
MDPSLHQKQGINHLKRVLSYAPFVAEGGEAEVHLTAEDWHVVADTLFQMNTPRTLLPAEIVDFRMTESFESIELDTADGLIRILRM